KRREETAGASCENGRPLANTGARDARAGREGRRRPLRSPQPGLEATSEHAGLESLLRARRPGGKGRGPVLRRWPGADHEEEGGEQIVRPGGRPGRRLRAKRGLWNFTRDRLFRR